MTTPSSPTTMTGRETEPFDFLCSPPEAIVLRHALMSYRNGISERNRDDAPYPMSDGFELVTADALIERLDAASLALLRKNDVGALAVKLREEG